MAALFSEGDGSIAAVAEMLQRERPVPTFDELVRVDRRLVAARAPQGARRGQRRPARRAWSRLAVMACLSLGLIFATAGTGLALSGFATPGPPVHAQYPDIPVAQASTPAAGAAPARRDAQRHVKSPTLGRINTTGAAFARYVSLVHAETANELPFTGFAAIPVLLAGIALIATGAMIHRRTSAG